MGRIIKREFCERIISTKRTVVERSRNERIISKGILVEGIVVKRIILKWKVTWIVLKGKINKRTIIEGVEGSRRE